MEAGGDRVWVSETFMEAVGIIWISVCREGTTQIQFEIKISKWAICEMDCV